VTAPVGLGGLGAALLRRIDPETAHGLSIQALKTGLVPSRPVPRDPRLLVPLFDMTLAHPVGMAAGFDKNAEVAGPLAALGFAYVEVGTLTPRAQPGNPRPRIFRLPEIGGVINRLGFNNEGHSAAFARLNALRNRGVIGVNVGANKDSADRAGDYVEGIRRFARVASYFTVNVSSPNTPSLRDLQARDMLDDLAARVMTARDDETARTGRRVPVLLKIAPDMTEAALDDIAEVVLARGIDGLVISNTTLSRAGVDHPMAGETGGLSGKPIFARSTIVLAKMRRRVGRQMPIIGVGGISSGADAYEKLAAGANAVQLYTGFIYGGPELPGRIVRDLIGLLDRTGAASITDVTGIRTDAWADRAIPA
jgi:dihydroorotate dehydrogenase